MAKPPGGREEHPVVNWRNAFLSAPVISTNTFTNLRNPGDSLLYPSLGSVYFMISSLVKTGSWSTQRAWYGPTNMIVKSWQKTTILTSLGVKAPSSCPGGRRC